MPADGFITVVKWDEFQHYKDRSPPWIKLYTWLLDKYEWLHLPDPAKAHLTGIWLLASRLENKIPNDPAWIAVRIGATSVPDLELLAAAGFIEFRERRASKPLALCLQDASAEERRGETQSLGEEKTEKAGADAPPLKLPDEEQPAESLGAWYGRALKPLLYVRLVGKQRDQENRDISVLKNQLRNIERPSIEDAVGEARRQAEAGELRGWIEPGDNFSLRALLAEANGGIATFERFRHAAVKRREAA